MTKVLKLFIFIYISLVVIYLPLVLGKFYVFSKILPAFEIIFLFIYIKYESNKVKTAIIFASGILLAFIYDISLITNILLIIVAYKLNEIMERQSFLIHYNHNHNPVVTDYGRFIIFAFIELNLKYCSECLCNLYIFDYSQLLLQILNTIFYYPVIYLLIDLFSFSQRKKFTNY